MKPNELTRRAKVALLALGVIVLALLGLAWVAGVASGVGLPR